MVMGGYIYLILWILICFLIGRKLVRYELAIKHFYLPFAIAIISTAFAIFISGIAVKSGILNFFPIIYLLSMMLGWRLKNKKNNT